MTVFPLFTTLPFLGETFKNLKNMYSVLNRTSTVSYLVIALIVLVIAVTFFVKKNYVTANGEKIEEETASFVGFKKKK
jgi:uncharacterized membrane protein YqiK